MEGTLKTTIGNLYYNLASKDCVYISCDPYGSLERTHKITVRGKDIYCSLHLHKMGNYWNDIDHQGNVWNIKNHYDFYGDVTTKQKEVILKAVIDAWTNLITPEMLHEAEINTLKSNIKTAESVCEELQHKLEESKNKLIDLKNQLKQLEQK